MLCLPLVIAAMAASPPPAPQATMPDAVQTFNLWSHFIAEGSIEGALALTYAPAITDRAALAAQLDDFAGQADRKDGSSIALGGERASDIALVHVFDGRLPSGAPDFDPALLIRDDGAWKLLPIFGGSPRGGLPYLDAAANTALGELLHDYMNDEGLAERYAAQLAAMPGQQETPQAAAARFWDHLYAGRADEAIAMCHDPGDPRAAFQLDEFRRLADRFATGELDGDTCRTKVLEEWVDGTCAIVVVVHELREGRPAGDLDTCYFVERDGAWFLYPTDNLSDVLEMASDEESQVFKRLSEPARAFRAEQQRRHRPPLEALPAIERRVFRINAIRDSELIRRALADGLDPNLQATSRHNRDHLLTFAARHGAHETMTLLIDAGADVNARSRFLKKTPIFQAAYEGDVQAVRLLIDAGADVHALDDSGNNALREAISGGPAVIRMLLDAGADPKQRNAAGNTMADLIMEHGSEEAKAELARSPAG